MAHTLTNYQQAVSSNTKIFDIPELVELIIKFVDQESLLSLILVSRTFAEAGYRQLYSNFCIGWTESNYLKLLRTFTANPGLFGSIKKACVLMPSDDSWEDEREGDAYQRQLDRLKAEGPEGQHFGFPGLKDEWENYILETRTSELGTRDGILDDPTSFVVKEGSEPTWDDFISNLGYNHPRLYSMSTPPDISLWLNLFLFLAQAPNLHYLHFSFDFMNYELLDSAVEAIEKDPNSRDVLKGGFRELKSLIYWNISGRVGDTLCHLIDPGLISIPRLRRLDITDDKLNSLVPILGNLAEFHSMAQTKSQYFTTVNHYFPNLQKFTTDAHDLPQWGVPPSISILSVVMNSNIYETSFRDALLVNPSIKKLDFWLPDGDYWRNILVPLEWVLEIKSLQTFILEVAQDELSHRHPTAIEEMGRVLSQRSKFRFKGVGKYIQESVGDEFTFYRYQWDRND